MPTILFICAANMFRSPIAAALLKEELGKYADPDQWTIISAGTWTKNGEAAPSMTLRKSQRLGLIGLDKHQTIQVDAGLITGSDLIIVMESNQREALGSEFPSGLERIFLLSEFLVGNKYDIPDPAKLGAQAEEVANEIAAIIKSGAGRIMSTAKDLASTRIPKGH